MLEKSFCRYGKNEVVWKMPSTKVPHLVTTVCEENRTYWYPIYMPMSIHKVNDTAKTYLKTLLMIFCWLISMVYLLTV